MNPIPPSDELPMLRDLSLSDLSDYDVEAGYEAFIKAAEATPVEAASSAGSGAGLWKLLPWGAAAVALGVGLGSGALEPAPGPTNEAMLREAAPVAQVLPQAKSASSPASKIDDAPAAPLATPPPTPPNAERAPAVAVGAPAKAKAKTKSAKPAGKAPAKPEVSAIDPNAELMMAAQMRQALSSDPARALELARAGQEEFPDGIFVRERLAHEILALVALNRPAQARAKARGFLKRYPNGPQSDQVRRALESGASN